MAQSFISHFQIAKHLPEFEEELTPLQETEPKVYQLGRQLIERYVRNLYIRRAAAVLAIPGLAVTYFTHNLIPFFTAVVIWLFAMLMCLMTATRINQIKDQYHLED